MPSLIAFCLATALALTVGIEWDAARWLRALVGIMVWLGGGAATRRLFRDMRPE